MTAFRYRALDPAGKTAVGVVEADSERSARAAIRERGLFLLQISSISRGLGKFSGRSLRSSDLALLTRQWATLLESGLTLEESLAALIAQAESEARRQLLAGVRSEILAGYSLHAALEQFPQAFPNLYRASIAAGEKSGELAGVMVQLADYLERTQALRSKTLQALIYPVVVAIVALLVIIGLMTYVVPQVVHVFEHGKQALPPLTRGLIAVSNFLRTWGWLLALLLASALFAGGALLKRPVIKARWDAWWLAFPLIGKHLRTLDATRFASTLAILAGSGVPLLSALEAGRKVINRQPIADAVANASERVREGQSLSSALAASRQFPALLIHMIANGEATGRLDELLERAARLQQGEMESRTATLTTLLEPLLLLTMGAFVLLIVLAVMQPIIEINTLMR